MTAYDDLDSPQAMHDDAAAVGHRLPLTAPSLRFEDYPREAAKPEIQISEAARRIANALHLHLD